MRTYRLFSLVALGACLAGTASVRAQDATASSPRQASSPSDAGGVPIPARLSLLEALRLAEQRHPSLAAATSRVAAARATAAAAATRPNPLLSYSSEGYQPWTTGARTFNEQETVVQVAQELETGGRRRLRTDVAEAGVRAAAAGLRNEARQLRLDTQLAYFQLVLARSEVETATVALAEIDKVITVNQSRYRQGEISGVEFRRLEVERMKFTEDLLGAHLGEKNARGALLALLGAARLDAPLEPTDSLAVGGAAAPRGDVETSGLLARALANRGDLDAAREEERRAAGEVRLQQALRLPNVTFGAGYRRDFGDNGLVVSISLPLPLFDRNAGGIARAEAERRAAEAQRRRVQQAVSLEVQQALNGAQAARERLTALETEYLQKAREARDGALAAYRAGSTDLIDYLDAQRAYRDVQRAYQRALFDQRMSLAELEAATGGSAEHLP